LKGKISIEIRVSCLYLHKLSKKIFHGTHMFADWLKFASDFSTFL